MDHARLTQQLRAGFSGTVAVIGDVILDEFLWCTVNRISPEAPVPVCHVQDTTLVPGGAANVAHNIRSLGGKVFLLGVVGDDAAKAQLEMCLQNLNVDPSDLVTDSSRPTVIKTRIIAHRQHVVRVDREAPQPISADIAEALLKKLDAILPQVQVVLLSDYAKGCLTDQLSQEVVKRCRKAGIKVVVDPKGTDYAKYHGATVITPNFSEFQAAVQQPITTEAQVHQHGLNLRQSLELEAMLVTRSEKGMSIIFASGEKVDIPTRAREVYDITGAGDTAVAAMSLALASGWTLADAAQFSNYAAGVVVGKVGTATTTVAEVIHAVERDARGD